MGNYISANKVKKLKQYCFQTELGVFPSHDYFVRVSDLLNIPIVEAEPVKCGQWELFDGDSNTYRCSVCGELWSLNSDTPVENNMNYCMCCGSKNAYNWQGEIENDK